MKIYQVFSGVYGCDVQLTYNHNKVLIKYEVLNQEVNTAATGVGVIRLSLTEDEFLLIMKNHSMKVTEVDRQITFDMFWDRYAYKVDKPLAIEQWNKLTLDERALAYDFVPAYKAQLQLNGGLGKKYAVRYLKHKPWIQ